MRNNRRHTSNGPDDKRICGGGGAEGCPRESRGFRIMRSLSISEPRVTRISRFLTLNGGTIYWRLKRHFGPALSSNVGFTSGTSWLRRKLRPRSLKRKLRGRVLTREIGKRSRCYSRRFQSLLRMPLLIYRVTRAKEQSWEIIGEFRIHWLAYGGCVFFL